MRISISWRTTDKNLSAATFCRELSRPRGVALTPTRSVGLNGNGCENDLNTLEFVADSLNQKFVGVEGPDTLAYEHALLLERDLRANGLASTIRIDSIALLDYVARQEIKIDVLTRAAAEAGTTLKAMRSMWHNTTLMNIRRGLERALEAVK